MFVSNRSIIYRHSRSVLPHAQAHMCAVTRHLEEVQTKLLLGSHLGDFDTDKMGGITESLQVRKLSMYYWANDRL